MGNEWSGFADGTDGYAWHARRYECGCKGRVGDSADGGEYHWSVMRREACGPKRLTASGVVVRKQGNGDWSSDEVRALVDAVHDTVCDTGGE
jgi:hypothetical protein